MASDDTYERVGGDAPTSGGESGEGLPGVAGDKLLLCNDSINILISPYKIWTHDELSKLTGEAPTQAIDVLVTDTKTSCYCFKSTTTLSGKRNIAARVTPSPGDAGSTGYSIYLTQHKITGDPASRNEEGVASNETAVTYFTIPVSAGKPGEKGYQHEEVILCYRLNTGLLCDARYKGQRLLPRIGFDPVADKEAGDAAAARSRQLDAVAARAADAAAAAGEARRAEGAGIFAGVGDASGGASGSGADADAGAGAGTDADVGGRSGSPLIPVS